MYQFGVKLRQEEDGRIVATLVDLPSGPYGSGATAEEAYQDIITKSAPHLTKFILTGGKPAPIADDKTATITIDMPAQMRPAMPPSAPAAQVGKRDTGAIWNYGWRNGPISTEG